MSGKQLAPAQAQAPVQATAQAQAPGVAAASAGLEGNAAMAEQLASATEKSAGGEHDGHDHGAEQAPAPATGAEAARLQAERPKGTAIPAAIRARLFAGLNAAPASAQTLANIKRASGNTNFPMLWSDRGSYQSGGSIHLDNRETEENWLVVMMHELVHLQTHVTGQAANPRRLSREAFVKAKMDDEINAQAVAYISLFQTGVTSSSASGFNEFYREIRRPYSRQLQAQDWTTLHSVAFQWLENKYKSGTWKTSNTGENYYDYWGAAWDRSQ